MRLRKDLFNVAETAMPRRRWRIGHVNVEQNLRFGALMHLFGSSCDTELL